MPYEGEDESNSESSLRTPTSSNTSESGEDESGNLPVPELKLLKSVDQEKRIYVAKPRDKRKSVDIFVRKIDASPSPKNIKHKKNESYVKD